MIGFVEALDSVTANVALVDPELPSVAVVSAMATDGLVAAWVPRRFCHLLTVPVSLATMLAIVSWESDTFCNV